MIPLTSTVCLKIRKPLCFAVLVVACLQSVAGWAAVISGPATNTSGSFTLSWPAGYELWLDDGTWRYAASPTTSFGFANLPSGSYKFVLVSCYAEPPFGVSFVCGKDPSSVKIVEVTREQPILIQTSSLAAGTSPHSEDVSSTGSSQVVLPIKTIPGVNGVAPKLALGYDSHRRAEISDVFNIEDLIGYGWKFEGLSRIQRCRAGVAGSDGAIDLNTTDRLCLDGQPMVLISGSYFGDNSEYRTEVQSQVKIVKQPGDWFEVRYPDGSIGRFGDTATSRSAGSGLFNITYLIGGSSFQVNPTYSWGLRQMTGTLGDVYAVDYDVVPGYGMLLPKQISYSNALVEFKYGPRGDLGSALIGSGNNVKINQKAVLHTIRVSMNGYAVREYRLNNATVGGRLRLAQMQECGYAANGGSTQCMQAMNFTWSGTWLGAQSYPIAVSGVTDGLGHQTVFVYTEIPVAANTPWNHTEQPFGAVVVPGGITPKPSTVVFEKYASAGLVAPSGSWPAITGMNATAYTYKGPIYIDATFRGVVGFAEVRSVDVPTGIHTYTQHRLVWPFSGAVSAIRSFSGPFGGGGQQLERREISYQLRTLPGGITLPLVTRDTRWHIDANVVHGATETEYLWCFVGLSGDNCPDYVTTTFEHPTQIYVLSQTGDAISVEPPASVWGEVQNHNITAVKQTSQTLVNFQNSSSPWIKQLPIKKINIETATGQPAKRVDDTFAYPTNTAIPVSRVFRSGDANALTWTRSFTGNNPTQECLYHNGSACIATSFGASYVDDRYPPSVSNALGQSTSVTYDTRFGTPASVTDPDSNQTQFQYDAFGRVITTLADDGTTTNTIYERCDLTDCSGVIGAQPAVRVRTTVTNGVNVSPNTTQYLDVLGRVVLEEVEALDSLDGQRRVRTAYDTLGRVKFVTRPYFSSGSTLDCTAAGPNCTWFTYDIRNRVTREDRPDGGYTTNSYSVSAGSTSTVSTDVVKRPGNTDQTRSRQHTYNVLGQLIATIDALVTSSQIQNSFYYDSHGNLSQSYVGSTLIATMTYDLAGNRLTLNDVNTGNYTFQYNGRGLMTQSTDALGQVTQYSYDALGRQRFRYDRVGLGNAVTNEWNWDAPAATGQLEYVTNGQFQENYSYQAIDAKLSSVSTSINVAGVLTKNYSRSFTYDTAGRLATIGYPNLTVTHEYSSLGYLTKYKNGSTVLDEVKDTDAFGNVTEQRFNNSTLRTSRSYESTMGRLTSIQTGTTATPMSVQDLQYVWQSDNFPLLRQDRNTTSTTDDYRDVYNYDDLGRMYRQQTDLSVNRISNFAYDVLGNLTSKTSSVSGDLNVTGYTYATAGKPHRLTSVNIGGVGQTLSYNSNGSMTQYDAASGNDTFFEYDGQNNVQSVTVGVSAGTTTPKAKDEFWYTPDGDRFLGRETWDASGVQRVAITTYLGAFEEIKPSAESGYNLFRRVQVTPTVMWKWRSVSSGATLSDWRYQHRDHLGSMDAMTDGTGALVSSVVGKTSFDPFGGRRSKDWSRDITPAELQALLFVDYEDEQSPRGFTDHEMLNRTGFIHMNGRVYDPRIGRFVSADPIVQAPTFSQSYNRYAYVFNNPVSHTDPDGYFAIPSAFQVTASLGRLRISFGFNLRTRRFSIGIPIGFGRLPIFGPIAPTGGLPGASGGVGGIGNCFADAGCSARSGVLYLETRDPKYQRKPDSIERDTSNVSVLPEFIYVQPVQYGTKEERREFYRAPLAVASAPIITAGVVRVGIAAPAAARVIADKYRQIPGEIREVLNEQAREAFLTILLSQDPHGRAILENYNDRKPDEAVQREESVDERKSRPTWRVPTRLK